MYFIYTTQIRFHSIFYKTSYVIFYFNFRPFQHFRYVYVFVYILFDIFSAIRIVSMPWLGQSTFAVGPSVRSTYEGFLPILSVNKNVKCFFNVRHLTLGTI